MQLDRLSAELRPRNAWEAMDLGLQMARARYLKLWLLWWLSALPVTLLMALLLHQYPQYISSAVWWFKPLFEPVLLFWLSRALFNEDPSMQQARSNWWQVTRHRLFVNLTWRRLSPNRSMFLPITQLEQPDAQAWRARTRVFGKQFSGGTWLTVIGMHFEGVLTIGLVLGAALLVPQELLPDWEFLEWIDEDNQSMSWIWAAAGILAMSLIAPFYVAGGFALYLSRRTNLEAWDIELGFRRWVERMSPTVLPVLLLIGVLAVPEAHAGDGQRAQAGQVIAEVLESEDFGSEETVTRWRFKDQDEPDRKRHSEGLRLEGLAQFLEVLAWLAVAMLLAWVVAQLYLHSRQWSGRRRPDGRAVQPAGINRYVPDRNAALPADIPGTVREALHDGDLRGAVSLLYRASLWVLQQQRGLQLEDSATEGECLAEVRRTRPQSEGEFFGELTRQWIRVAYADLQPPPAQVETLLEQWSRVYGEGAAAPETGQ